MYDTKVLSLFSQSTASRWGKSDLQHLYYKSTHNKKYNNNLVFEADCKQKYPQFSHYEQNKGQDHDAGYDAYMTGVVFATSAKYIEIGKIVEKIPGYENVNKAIEEEIGLSQTSTLSHAVGGTLLNEGALFGSDFISSAPKGPLNKRNRKTARKE